MLSEKKLREIKEYEEAGIDVVAIGSHGTLDYSTQGMGAVNIATSVVPLGYFLILIRSIGSGTAI